MNRLLQGDVGSGKTLVALYAMLVAVAHGKQAVLMAPTEILARQHADSLASLLEASRVRYGLLAGGTAKADREKILAEIASGEIDVVLGTHAVIQDSVKFHDLGLVVIDEQHKFGVRQRAALRQGDESPHYLVMTATPIPRTLTMTLFGDLDISTLTELPGGRQPINTYLVEPEHQARWWNFVRDRLREGRQAYRRRPAGRRIGNHLCPQRRRGVRATHQRRAGSLSHGTLAWPDVSGREATDDGPIFRDGETQVLVSTTVIEVGVDVPNASVMTVAGAERFGLAQLHQLRGRVGRGQSPRILRRC